VLQCVAVYCSASWDCAAVCCSVLQCEPTQERLLSMSTGPFPTTKQEGMRMAVADVFASLRLNSTGFLPVCDRERQKERKRAHARARLCVCACAYAHANVFAFLRLYSASFCLYVREKESACSRACLCKCVRTCACEYVCLFALEFCWLSAYIREIKSACACARVCARMLVRICFSLCA